MLYLTLRDIGVENGTKRHSVLDQSIFYVAVTLILYRTVSTIASTSEALIVQGPRRQQRIDCISHFHRKILKTHLCFGDLVDD